MLPVLKRNRTNPVGWDFFDVGREIDRLLGGEFGGASRSGSYPATDISESANEFAVSAELPGLTAEDVEVSVEDGVLSLSGEKKAVREEGDENKGRHVVERRYGRFHRTFTLPRSVDAAKVNAKFTNGVLTVTLPKAATAKARKVKIAS